MKRKKLKAIIVSALLSTSIVVSSMPIQVLADGAKESTYKYAKPEVLKDANDNAYDLDGMTIVVRDWWSDPNEELPDDEYGEARKEYLDWIQETYHFTIHREAISDWGDAPSDFIEYVDNNGDDNNYVFTLRSDPAVVAAIDSGYCYDLATLDCLDFRKEKFQKNLTHEQYARGASIYGMDAGAPEPRTGVFFNKKLLNDAGIDPDSLYDMQADGTWTWSAFVALCDQLKQAGITPCDANNGVMTEMAVYSNGGEFVGLNDEGEYVCKVNSKKTLEGLEFADYLFKNYWLEEPEEALWNYYEQAFYNGEYAFWFDQAYMGSSDGLRNIEDDWGFVMFPKGPQSEDYTNCWTANVLCIPACYDADRAWKIAFAWDLFTDEAPGFENNDEWKNDYNSFEKRAVDETLTMMRTKGFVTHHNMVAGLDFNDIGWTIGPDGPSVSEAVRGVLNPWKENVGQENEWIETYATGFFLSSLVLGEGRAFVNWSPADEVDYYRILRKTGDGEWEKLAVVNKANGSTYADATIVMGNTYTYAVQGVSADDLTELTERSNQKSILVKPDLSAPDLYKPMLIGDGVLIQWDQNRGVELYQVLRKKNGGDWTILETCGGNVYYDYDVEFGDACTYTVQGVDLYGSTVLTARDEEGVSIQIGADGEFFPPKILLDANNEPYNLGGITIYIRDWWSEGDPEPTNQYEEIRAQYLEWIQETYNFTIQQRMMSEWDSAPQDFVDYVVNGGDEENYAFILREGDELNFAIANELCYDLATLDCLDFSKEKFQANKTHEKYSFGDKIYCMSAGAPEPRTGVFFNKRLLSDAGINPESLYTMQADGTWTWDAFLALCKKIKDTYGDAIYACNCNNSVMTEAAVYSNGGEFVGKDADGKFIDKLTDEKTLEGLEFAKTLFETYWQEEPEEAEWDYFKEAFLNGEYVFLFEETWAGQAGGYLEKMEDEWGFVMFPKGPKASDYINCWNDNPVCIPGCYDADTAWKIAFAWNLYTDEAPGYQDEDNWKENYKMFDSKAFEQTIPMMKEKGMVTYHGLVSGLRIDRDLTWQLSPGSPSVSELVSEIAEDWEDCIDQVNDPNAHGPVEAIIRSCQAGFEGNLHLYFNMMFSDDLLADEGAYVEIVGEQTVKIFLKDGIPTKSDDGTEDRLTFPYLTYANELRKEIVLKVYDGNNHVVSLKNKAGDKNFTKAGFSYSLYTYATKMLTSPEPGMPALAQALIDYGTAAQYYFDFETEGLTGLRAEVLAVKYEDLAAFAPESTGSKFAGVTKRTLTGSFEADNAVYISYYLPVGADVSGYEFKIFDTKGNLVSTNVYHEKVTNNENGVDVTYDVYRQSVQGLAADELGNPYVFKMIQKDTGKEWTVTASVLTYARSSISKEAEDPNRANLGRALYLYYQAADAYFD